jgi:hypothetical protein
MAVVSPAAAQEASLSATQQAWRPLLAYKGLEITFIFYRRADNFNNGVVIKLVNTNAHVIDFRFTILFRSEARQFEELVEGRLEPGEARTGSNDGLFWIPFPDGSAVGEVGLRGYRVSAAPTG